MRALQSNRRGTAMAKKPIFLSLMIELGPTTFRRGNPLEDGFVVEETRETYTNVRRTSTISDLKAFSPQRVL